MVHDVNPYYNVCSSWFNHIHVEIKYTLNYFHWPAPISLPEGCYIDFSK